MKTLIVSLILIANLFAQDSTEELSGILSLDSKQFIENNYDTEIELQSTQKRSALLAASLSLLIPGAGQYYNENYLRAGLFILAEAAGITLSAVYNKKGDDQTAFFENFAKEHWSVNQYAKWTLNFALNNGLVNQGDYDDLLVNSIVNWNVLNNLEETVSKTNIGKYYSHRLAPLGDQQYYEMIGKYAQFNPGWDDFGDEFTPFVYGDPVTDTFKSYSGMRGEANDLYSVAKTAVIAVVVNHIVSAVEAALSVKSYNDNLKLSMNVKRERMFFSNVYYPELTVKVNF